MEKSNLVFIGMPGAGKSTVGVVVAKMLGLDFVDGDLLIQRAQDATLEQIIAARGVAGFLDVENEVLSGIDCARTLVATGGSAVYSDAAMEHLRELGTVVYLKVPCDELAVRLGSLVERGVVMHDGSPATLDALCAEREPLYDTWAEITIDTSGLSLRETAEAVVAAVR